MAPVITSVTPSSGANDAAVTITILGTGFVSGATVTIGDESADNVVFVNSNYLTCEVPSGITPGIYDVTLTNPDTTEDTLEDAYRVKYTLPDPPFDLETEANIITRMLANTVGNWDKRQGSFYRDLISPVAFEIARIYENANILLQMIFPQTTSGNYLSLLGEQHGLLRNAAVKATGQITISGTDGTVIPAGTLFSTTVTDVASALAVEFESTASGTISGGTATVNIVAVEAGESGNVEAGKINNINTFISGVSSVSNASGTTGGAEEESDADFRERLLQFTRNPVAGGNKADYVTWALEVDGVGGAVCEPLWNGPGTVRVIIVDENGDIPNNSIVTAVQDYISPTSGTGEGKAPIGAEVTVEAPSTVNINVAVTVTVASGYNSAAVKAAVENNLEAFIKALPIGDDVKYTAIANVIFDTEGVDDYSSLQVNGGTANIAISATQKAKPNTLTVS